MAEENKNRRHVCYLCGANVNVANAETSDLDRSSGGKPTRRELQFRLTCCDTCYPCAPFALFLRGLIFGHALSSLLRSVSCTLSPQATGYDGDGDYVSDADEHQTKNKETYDKAFYLPNFMSNSLHLEAESPTVASNVTKSTGLIELEEIESGHIKTEIESDEDQDVLDDVLELNNQNDSSTETQTEVVRPEGGESKLTPGSLFDKLQGKVIRKTPRRKTRLKSPVFVGTGKQSQTKTCKQKTRRKMTRRLVAHSSVKQEVSVDSVQTYAVRPYSKATTRRVKKPKSTRKKRLTTQCSVCYQLLAKFMLGRHMETKHPGQVGVDDGFFHCKDCGEKFKELLDLQAHSSAEHRVLKNFKCKICSMSFAKIRNLSLHTRLTHKLAYMKECDICGEGFQKWEELPKHRFKVHGVSDHPCHVCGKSFVHEQALNAHLDAHAGVKKYFCEVCGKGFVRFTNLCTHKLIHASKTGSKPDQSGDGSDDSQTAHSRKKEDQRNCALCIQAVVTKSTVCHIHSAQSSTRAYVCSVCGKGFMSSSHLSAHSKQHLEPRFSCDMCAKRFTYKCNLNSHRLSHLPLANKKIFHCRHCSKTFNTKNNLSLHERSHEEPTYYSCYVCAKGFTRSSNLYRHIRNMHPEHTNHSHSAGIEQAD